MSFCVLLNFLIVWKYSSFPQENLTTLLTVSIHHNSDKINGNRICATNAAVTSIHYSCTWEKEHFYTFWTADKLMLDYVCRYVNKMLVCLCCVHFFLSFIFWFFFFLFWSVNYVFWYYYYKNEGLPNLSDPLLLDNGRGIESANELLCN